MTDAEIIALVRSATIPLDEFIHRVRYGYRGAPYNEKATAYYKAWAAARQVGPTPPPPPPTPPPAVDNSLGKAWIFMAQEPDRAIWYPSYYGIAFTADPAYPKPSASTLSILRSRGQRIRSWCDCHSTFPATAISMAVSLGLDGWIGEGESAPACQVAFDAGAQLVIGNLSALTEAQKDWIRRGKSVWINELYLNQDESRAQREDWMNLPVAGRCIASYDASGEAATGKRFPVSEYLRLGKFQRLRDSFYDPGSTDEDRHLLP